MPIELSTDLPQPLVPLAWLIGRWEGAGVVGYPTIEEANFGQEVEFSHDGRPFLSYTSRTWLLDAEGAKVRPLATETGFWRVPGQPGAAEGGGTEVEFLLAHPTGFVEIYVGTVNGPRIDLITDLVARTATAKEYTSAKRMYGLVESDLLWVLDMAAMGQPLQSHASARLKRTS
ncbi:FABP family protein [Spongisporangium articulatum]|uniref:Peroxynitrite isomerase n=1 Tax=Spongisporangium articulatum TaxID=3362603 RepID=A0ABW8AJQ7_9ACTN